MICFVYIKNNEKNLKHKSHLRFTNSISDDTHLHFQYFQWMGLVKKPFFEVQCA